MKFFSKWTEKKHVILSLFIILIVSISSFISKILIGSSDQSLIKRIITMFSKTDSSSIGIIGGADGPTVIFVSGNPVIVSIIPKVVLFLLLLGMYIPMKKYFKKVSEENKN